MSKWKELRESKEEAPAQVEEVEDVDVTLDDVEQWFTHDFAEDGPIITAIKERREEIKHKHSDYMDTDCYLTACFSNFQQLSEFCNSLRLDSSEEYMDGRVFVRKLKRAL